METNLQQALSALLGQAVAICAKAGLGTATTEVSLNVSFTTKRGVMALVSVRDITREDPQCPGSGVIIAQGSAFGEDKALKDLEEQIGEYIKQVQPC